MAAIPISLQGLGNPSADGELLIWWFSECPRKQSAASVGLFNNLQAINQCTKLIACNEAAMPEVHPLPTADNEQRRMSEAYTQTDQNIAHQL